MEFYHKIGWDRGDGIGKVRSLVAGNGYTILGGCVKVQQELHGKFLSGHAVRSSCCIPANDVQLGDGR